MAYGNSRILEDTASYVGLLLAPVACLPFRQKKAYYAVFANLGSFLVSSSNLGNFW